jgi:DNA-binding NtrC family response regulator
MNQAAEDKLIAYHWPGNVRELQHTMERAVILAEDRILKPSAFLLNSQGNETLMQGPETLEEMERMMIEKALQRHNGNHSAAAEQLGISRQTLYNKLKKSEQG